MEYKLKKDYLTRVESNAIIVNAMKGFYEEGIVDGLNFNYLGMDERFFDSLGLLCIEDYNDEIKEFIYNEGKTEELLASITNAEDAYNMLYMIADKTSSLENIMYGLLKNIPDMKDLKNLDDLAPRLNNAFDKYEKIIHKNNEGETTEK